MARASPGAILCVMLLTGPTSAVDAQNSTSREPWRLSGSYLNLFSSSRTAVAPQQSFALDLNRLRLRLEGEPITRVRVDVQTDIEMLLGNYLHTEQYSLLEARAERALDHDLVANENVVVRHRLYRGTLSWSGSMLDLVIGRQRIPLGTGRFWSALDLLNPIDPTRLERDYRAGVDAVLAERAFGALSRLSAVYVPATERSRSTVAAYARGNMSGADYSLLVGSFDGDAAIGSDFARDVGGLGVRGEVTVTRPASGPTYGRALLGADYGFPSTLTMTVELYYNGQGTGDPADYDFPALIAGRTLNLARHYGAMALSYDVTPLAKVALYTVLNADDHSGVLWPRFEYSLATNFDVAAGVQWFIGGPQTEYGRLSNLLHAEVRWFF